MMEEFKTDYRPKHIQEAERKAREIATAAADKFCDESPREVSEERYQKIFEKAYIKAWNELTDEPPPFGTGDGNANE